MSQAPTRVSSPVPLSSVVSPRVPPPLSIALSNSYRSTTPVSRESSRASEKEKWEAHMAPTTTQTLTATGSRTEVQPDELDAAAQVRERQQQ